INALLLLQGNCSRMISQDSGDAGLENDQHERKQLQTICTRRVEFYRDALCATKGMIRHTRWLERPSERLQLSLSDHVRRVLVVLFADAFDEIGIWYQTPGQLDSPWLRISLWIVDRDLNVHVTGFRPGETFNDPQPFGPR